MTEQEFYTQIFQKAIKESTLNINDKDLKRIWTNPTKKRKGGLGLSEFGLKVLKEGLNLESYTIKLPPNVDLKPQVIVWMDQFLNCPFYLTPLDITVFNERKAVELHLFAGDIHKYGLGKAKTRQMELQKRNIEKNR